MSYFLFGSFDSLKEKQVIQNIKDYGKKKGVFFWFNEEINFYEDIFRMCNEQHSKKDILFTITSSNQPYNSSDLLFPYDKFTNEELFSDISGTYYKECCKNNIKILFDCLEKLLKLFQPNKIDIFVVEGYDTDFKRKKCTLTEMKMDILVQIETESFIKSCIYELANN